MARTEFQGELAEEDHSIPELEPPKPKLIAGLPILTAEERIDHVKLLVYGDAGVGKTRLAASASEVKEMSPVLFVDAEGGIKSIRHLYPKIEVVRIADQYNARGQLVAYAWDKFVDLYETFKAGVDYKTIVIDSLTEVYAASMNKVMQQLVIEKEHRDVDLPDKREYNKAGAQVRRTIRLLRDLPKHVIITCTKSTKEDRETGRVINYVPDVPGKLAYGMAQYVDELFPMYTKSSGKEVVRLLMSQPEEKYLAKDRSDRMPRYMEQPTMQKIADLVIDKE